MNTQELKQYIDRVLGNKIRCLLPSFWWKRLFGLVVDKVEEVEGSIVSSLDEFAKERPDIEMRTFYVSEDAELVAHNVQVFKALLSDAAKKKIGPYYIATTIDEDQQVWFIRNESFYPSGVGALPTFIIEEDSKKYVVIFFMDGAYIKQETEDDSVTVDTEMSSTSENAVQNKVIKAYVDKSIEDYDQSISEAILGELDKKVDKVEGKQLSTEDFTTALKTKLEGMSSFDPTEINNKVDGLQSQINTLVSGDASTAIESFNEIIAFLNGVQDSESLERIVAGIEQQIAAKQNTLVSGTNIKTINGISLLGSGNIEISGGGGSSSGSGAYSEVNHGTSDTTFTLTPNTFHVWEEVSALTLTLGSETAGVANEYLFQFTSGATATTLTLPDDIKWANDAAPTIAENKVYQVSILKGMASVLEFSNAIVFPLIGSTNGLDNEEYAKVYEYFVNTYNLTSTSDLPSNGVVITEALMCNDPYFGGPVLKVSLYGTRLLLWTQNAIDSLVVPSITNLGMYQNHAWD